MTLKTTFIRNKKSPFIGLFYNEVTDTSTTNTTMKLYKLTLWCLFVFVCVRPIYAQQDKTPEQKNAYQEVVNIYEIVAQGDLESFKTYVPTLEEFKVIVETLEIKNKKQKNNIAFNIEAYYDKKVLRIYESYVATSSAMRAKARNAKVKSNASKVRVDKANIGVNGILNVEVQGNEFIFGIEQLLFVNGKWYMWDKVMWKTQK